jgi:hypothetical protein
MEPSVGCFCICRTRVLLESFFEAYLCEEISRTILNLTLFASRDLGTC